MDYGGDLRFRKYIQISDVTAKTHEKSIVSHFSEMTYPILTKLGSIESYNLVRDEVYINYGGGFRFGSENWI